MSTTPNYGWDKPTVGGDAGSWGTKLNTILDNASAPQGVDQVVKAVSDVANAALPKAGGTMTGEVEIKTERAAVEDKGTISGATTLDIANADFFYGTKSGWVTFTFSRTGGMTSGKLYAFMLELTNGGSAGTLTWPTGTKWPGGTPPTLTASGVDVLVFYTRDAGTTWRGALSMENSA